LFIQGHFEESIASISRAIETFRIFARPELIAHGLIDLASAELSCGMAAASLEHIQESVLLLRSLQDDYGLAIAIVTRGRAEQLAGNYSSAQITLEQSLADSERLGDASLRALALYGLGVNAIGFSQWDDAYQWLREAFKVTDSIGDRRRLAEILERFAQVEVGIERFEAAAQLLGRASLARRESETMTPPAHMPSHTAAIEATKQALGSERYEALFDEGHSRDAAQLVDALPHE
jgi:tetratricopeptide (TPR) repeat protein